jgi:aspartokinase
MPVRVGCSLSEGPETWIGAPREEIEMADTTQNRPEKDHSGPGVSRRTGPAQDAAADFPTESERILSVALEGKCTMVEIEGKSSSSDLAALLTDSSGAASWLWVEAFPRSSGSVVRGVCAESGFDEPALDEAVRRHGVQVHIQRKLAVASLVGEGILARPALLHEALACLSKARINVVAARSGSLSLSFLVEESAAARTVQILHDRFVTD